MSGPFIDWLTLRQRHPRCDVKPFNDGHVVGLSAEGEILWMADAAKRVEGSFETSVQVRATTSEVSFSGNISRFNRTDNVFGYDWGSSLARVNDLLHDLGIPKFEAGEPMQIGKNYKPEWSGAYATRIDVTRNYGAGSHQDAVHAMLFFGRQSAGVRKAFTRPDGATVEFGAGSKYVYEKIYLKYLEMLRHSGPCDPSLLAYVRDIGMLRHEVSLKTRFLSQRGLRFIGDISMSKLVAAYQEYAAKVLHEKPLVPPFAEIPDPYQGTVLKWKDGYDLSRMAKSTYNRHRRFLRVTYGIDISYPYDERIVRNRIQFVERQIAITPVAAPVDYWKKSA